MKQRVLLTAGGLAAFGIVLAALPSNSTAQSAAAEDQANCSVAMLQHKFEHLRDVLRERLGSGQEANMQIAARTLGESGRKLAQQVQELQNNGDLLVSDGDDISVVLSGDEGSWLGVETQEVTADKAKELKLPAERGVLLDRVVSDSPAAKAGLKENDVVTEINGQRVEGAAQFRRMIHEIPAGRSAQFTVWRDGRSQNLNVTLGKSEDRHSRWLKAAPGAFAFQVPTPEVDIPNLPDMDWGGMVFPGTRPRLGIDGEDLNGQLGNFFGAPDGEGVLVREVNSDSPAEKAGIKAGDVITKINGERIRSVGDLREKLAEKREDKTVKVSLLRNKNEISLTVELPAPAPKAKRLISHRTNI